MPIGSLIDPDRPAGPLLLDDGSLEDDLNGDGIVDIVISAEIYLETGWEPGGEELGRTEATFARVLRDVDFDGTADLYVGHGYQTRADAPDQLVHPSMSEEDQDNDGAADTWVVAGAVVSVRDGDDWFVFSRAAGQTAFDEDRDGRMDRWISGRAFDSVDNDGDGVIETWVFSPLVDERDTDGDGTADLRDTYAEQVLLDLDGDRIVDLLYDFGQTVETLTDEGWMVVSATEPRYSVQHVSPNDYFYSF